MKLSIAWIFDHIDADWKKVSIADLVDKFNKTTAEIEGFTRVTIAVDDFTLAEVTAVDKDATVLHSPELKKEYTLSKRSDVREGHWFLLKKQANGYTWSEVKDFHCNKEGLLPALYCEKDLRAGAWKQYIEKEDYILELDNKSITHRPDMWGHRGVAREVAALLEVPLRPLDDFIAHKNIKQYEYASPASSTSPFAISIEDKKLCKRFAGLYFEQIERRSSLLWMAHRLLRVDSRPIDALVDATNYVMLDISQPMHAFDAAKISSKNIVPRRAKTKEKLVLLDGQEIELTVDDLVITDGKKPIALAGIMGGLETCINAGTTSLFLESASFDAATVRKSSARFRQRTEASTRFEKSLDPNQNTVAILRFLQLISDAAISMKTAKEIVSVGLPAQDVTISVKHDFLEKRIGTSIAEDFVVNTLKKLEFEVSRAQGEYTIKVPSFRSTKDVTIKEDIVEEVGRFLGFETIAYELPVRKMAPFDVSRLHRLRKIKQCMAYALDMREVYNYSFYDESFLRVLGWEASRDALAVKNPVSENWQRLVASLIPGLLKSLDQNVALHDTLRFFEWGRIWGTTKNVFEQKSLAGIIFDKKDQVDFYDAKALLQKLFVVLDLEVTWERIDTPEYPWYMPYQSGCLMHKGEKVGVAGKVNAAFLHNVMDGDAFIFELNGDFLLSYQPEFKKYESLAKYPDVERDVSVRMPIESTVDELITMITKSDDTIIAVSLVDFFEDPSWKDERALTFRFVVRDVDKTLTKDEVDAVWHKVVEALTRRGATIR